MKDKILLAIKTKYANLGLSAKTLEGFANILVATVSEEEQIETAVNGLESFAKLAQSEADRVRQEAKAPKQPETPKPDAQPETPKMETPPNNDTPEWAKNLTETLESLRNKVDSLETEKALSSRRSVLEQRIEKANPTLKAKILKDFSRMKFESDDQFNEYLTETETDVSEIVQSEVTKALSETRPILGGGKTKDGVSSSTAEYIESTTKAQTETIGKPLFKTA